MKILYHSAPPMADTGYGVHTRNLIQRLRKEHEIAVHSVGGWEGMGVDWNGIQIYPSGAGKFGEKSIPYWYKKTDADVVFSHHDHWSFADVMSGLQQNGIPMVLYTILDHDLPGDKPPKAVVNANEHSLKTVAMSEWAEERLKNSKVTGDQLAQVPHAVNTTKYAPITDKFPKRQLKKELGIPEDGFLFGMIAANYGPRKNIPVHMEAFSRLVQDYGLDDVYLYIHTHPTMGGGYNLYDVREAVGLNSENCLFPDPHEMYHGLEDMVVVQLYNTFDVHLNVTQSESWGMTVTEAMSSETPVIAANNSAMTEQFGVPHDTFVTKDEGYRVTDQGILVHRGSEMWTQNATARRFTASVDNIVDAMLYYYNNESEIDKHGKNAREYVVENYDWDVVYEDHWKPLFDEIEEQVGGEYNDWYFKKRERETQSKAFNQEATQILLETRGDDVIDVGCGTGTLAEYLMEKGYNVVGVDKAKRAVEMAQDKGIEAYQDDILTLNQKDNSYDTAISQHVIEHVEADVEALNQLCRVARKKVIAIVPYGSVVNTDLDPTEERRYDKNEIERLKEEFETYTGYEMEYDKLTIGNDAFNWLITVDLEKE